MPEFIYYLSYYWVWYGFWEIDLLILFCNITKFTIHWDLLYLLGKNVCFSFRENVFNGITVAVLHLAPGKQLIFSQPFPAEISSQLVTCLWRRIIKFTSPRGQILWNSLCNFMTRRTRYLYKNLFWGILNTLYRICSYWTRDNK